ncbi:zinc finger protein 678-like [Ostrinia furnacalis]|uniref:zinc finger protein 678-like n=1 Tax=Ostrinia furnacalis TaxID=93504 RepID=UPI00103923F8|nr:zinc finger protein 678-like [Ostrinia furnacalis]
MEEDINILNTHPESQDRSNVQRLKLKLATICQAQRFCGICLESSDKLWSIDTEFDIAVSQSTHKKLLKDIIDYILNDESQQILASFYLCSNCTEKSIQSYLFIYNAKQLSKIIYECMNELYSKTVDVQNQLQSLDDCDANVVIVLEQEHEMSKYTEIGKMTEIIAKETSKNDASISSNTKQTENNFTTEIVRPIEIEEIHINNDEDINNQDIEITFIEEEIQSSEFEIDKEYSQVKTIVSQKKKTIPSITYKCTRCREVLPSYKSYKDHKKMCRKRLTGPNKLLFNCKVCNEKFVTQRSLNTHYKLHSKAKCKVCQFIVPEEDMTEHMRINHEEYAHLCKLCNFFSFSAKGLETHIEKNHSGPQCALCFKKVKGKDLKLHKCKFNCLECLDNVCIHYKYLVSYREQVLQKATKIQCVDCDYVCYRREALLGHVNREHLDHHPFTCAHCEQQFYSRTTLRYHINHFHKERHVCEYCDQEFGSKVTLENHRKLCQCIEKDYKCDQCKSSFETLEELANHVKLRHAYKAFDCNLCEKKFLNSSKLQDHMFKVHSGIQIKKKRSLLDCPICEEKCDNKRQLLQHIEIHGPDARFPCKECDMEFDCIRKLHRHIRIHYDDVIQCVDCKKVLTKTFFPHHSVYCNVGREGNEVCTCETCGKTFTTEVQFKFHMKVHLEKVPCPICKKPTKPIYMKGHIKRMHGKPRTPKVPKPKYVKNVKCDWCGHMVSRLGELETHVNRFHLKVKPYQCKYCQKTFFGKERLRDHLITHTSSRAVYCNICNQRFENKQCLKLHMRKHTGVKPYTCEICGESFRTSSIMNTHKVKKHSERTVACPLCDAMFHLTREMRCHFKKAHWKQKNRKFDPREVKELSPAFYHLFGDGRLPKVEGEELYISSKFNEKFG